MKISLLSLLLISTSVGFGAELKILGKCGFGGNSGKINPGSAFTYFLVEKDFDGDWKAKTPEVYAVSGIAQYSDYVNQRDLDHLVGNLPKAKVDTQARYYGQREDNLPGAFSWEYTNEYGYTSKKGLGLPVNWNRISFGFGNFSPFTEYRNPVCFFFH